VTVILGKPRQLKGGDWECPFQIIGLRIKTTESGYGVDAVQALTMTLEGIRVILEESGQRLSWIGGEPGDPGFGRLIPTSLGPAFSKRLNRIVDREIVRYVRLLKRRHRKQPRKSSRRSPRKGL
jgi:Domain of unknown function (DUF6968)